MTADMRFVRPFFKYLLVAFIATTVVWSKPSNAASLKPVPGYPLIKVFNPNEYQLSHLPDGRVKLEKIEHNGSEMVSSASFYDSIDDYDYDLRYFARINRFLTDPKKAHFDALNSLTQSQILAQVVYSQHFHPSDFAGSKWQNELLAEFNRMPYAADKNHVYTQVLKHVVNDPHSDIVQISKFLGFVTNQATDLNQVFNFCSIIQNVESTSPGSETDRMRQVPNLLERLQYILASANVMGERCSDSEAAIGDELKKKLYQARAALNQIVNPSANQYSTDHSAPGATEATTLAHNLIGLKFRSKCTLNELKGIVSRQTALAEQNLFENPRQPSTHHFLEETKNCHLGGVLTPRYIEILPDPKTDSSRTNLNTDPSRTNLNTGPSHTNPNTDPSRTNLNTGPSRTNLGSPKAKKTIVYQISTRPKDLRDNQGQFSFSTFDEFLIWYRYYNLGEILTTSPQTPNSLTTNTTFR